jgi:hypothetical protein
MISYVFMTKKLHTNKGPIHNAYGATGIFLFP